MPKASRKTGKDADGRRTLRKQNIKREQEDIHGMPKTDSLSGSTTLFESLKSKTAKYLSSLNRLGHLGAFHGKSLQSADASSISVVQSAVALGVSEGPGPNTIHADVHQIVSSKASVDSENGSYSGSLQESREAEYPVRSPSTEQTTPCSSRQSFQSSSSKRRREEEDEEEIGRRTKKAKINHVWPRRPTLKDWRFQKWLRRVARARLIDSFRKQPVDAVTIGEDTASLPIFSLPVPPIFPSHTDPSEGSIDAPIATEGVALMSIENVPENGKSNDANRNVFCQVDSPPDAPSSLFVAAALDMQDIGCREVNQAPSVSCKDAVEQMVVEPTLSTSTAATPEMKVETSEEALQPFQYLQISHDDPQIPDTRTGPACFRANLEDTVKCLWLHILKLNRKLAEKEERINRIESNACDEAGYPRHWSEKRIGKQKARTDEEEQTVQVGITQEEASHGGEQMASPAAGDDQSTSQSSLFDDLSYTLDILMEENKHLREQVALLTSQRDVCRCELHTTEGEVTDDRTANANVHVTEAPINCEVTPAAGDVDQMLTMSGDHNLSTEPEAIWNESVSSEDHSTIAASQHLKTISPFTSQFEPTSVDTLDDQLNGKLDMTPLPAGSHTPPNNNWGEFEIAGANKSSVGVTRSLSSEISSSTADAADALLMLTSIKTEVSPSPDVGMSNTALPVITRKLKSLPARRHRTQHGSTPVISSVVAVEPNPDWEAELEELVKRGLPQGFHLASKLPTGGSLGYDSDEGIIDEIRALNREIDELSKPGPRK